MDPQSDFASMSGMKRPAGIETQSDSASISGNKFDEPFEKRLEEFQTVTKYLQAEKMEPLLRAYFQDKELSNYWNKIKRELPRLGGAIEEKWKSIETLGRNNGQKEAKRQVLSLYIGKPDCWTQHAVVQVHTSLDRTEKETEEVWMSRGELEMKVGKETAADWIERGKLDKDEDSDGDSIYRKKTKRSNTINRTDHSKSTKRSGAIDADDFEGLKNALMDQSKKKAMRALASSAASSGSLETDAERLARLKQEEKEKKQEEREKKKREEEEEKKATATPESITKEKAEQMLSIVGKAKSDMAVKVIKLKKNRLASALKDEYALLLKNVTTMEKDLITMSSKTHHGGEAV